MKHITVQNCWLDSLTVTHSTHNEMGRQIGRHSNHKSWSNHKHLAHLTECSRCSAVAIALAQNGHMSDTTAHRMQRRLWLIETVQIVKQVKQKQKIWLMLYCSCAHTTIPLFIIIVWLTWSSHRFARNHFAHDALVFAQNDVAIVFVFVVAANNHMILARS